MKAQKKRFEKFHYVTIFNWFFCLYTILFVFAFCRLIVYILFTRCTANSQFTITITYNFVHNIITIISLFMFSSFSLHDARFDFVFCSLLLLCIMNTFHYLWRTVCMLSYLLLDLVRYYTYASIGCSQSLLSLAYVIIAASVYTYIFLLFSCITFFSYSWSNKFEAEKNESNRKEIWMHRKQSETNPL